MRAAVVREGRISVEERSRPEPALGEVLVKVRACGICGSDLHYVKHVRSIIDMAKGLGAPTDEMERAYRDGVVLGHEFVGEVVGFGPGAVQTLKIGDRVCSMPFVLKGGAPVLIGSNPETGGAYAEYMTLSEAMLLKVDETMSDEAAALVEPIGIAIHAVNKANLKAGDVAVVIGCGPIGLAVSAVLKMRGVEKIIASDLSPRRRALAQELCATEIIDGRQGSAVLRAAETAGGAPVVVFENTGARGMIGRIVLEAPQNARIIVTGIAAQEEALIPMVAIMKELAISFVIYYTPEEFAEALSSIRDEKIVWRPMITGKIGLDGLAQAFKDLEDPERHAKIIVDPFLRS